METEWGHNVRADIADVSAAYIDTTLSFAVCSNGVFKQIQVSKHSFVSDMTGQERFHASVLML